jgi:hypothetical protein
MTGCARHSVIPAALGSRRLHGDHDGPPTPDGCGFAACGSAMSLSTSGSTAVPTSGGNGGGSRPMSDEIVWQENDYLVIRTAALFATGFNAYRLNEGEAKKLNPDLHWFKTQDAAIRFIRDHQNA